MAGKLVKFPAHKSRERRLFNKSPSSENPLIVKPPQLMSDKEAIEVLKRFLPNEVTGFTASELRFPPELHVLLHPGGVEFTDTESIRPCFPHPDESLDEISAWVKHWHFAVFRKGNKLVGRYIDKEFPGEDCEPFEQPLRDPDSRYGKYNLTAFVERIVFGEGPD